MKKHWLRGILLGVSLTLLLASGVAMAQGLYARADKSCIVCEPENGQPSDDYVVHLDWGGWVVRGDWIHCEALIPPPSYPGWWTEFCWPSDTPDPKQREFGPYPCSINEALETWYGEWTLTVWQRDTNFQVVDSAEVSFLFLEECPEIEPEFVPEPGSIMLLGSGLMGLAGYAGLRLQKRQ